VAVVGAAGLSAEWGITELTDEEAEVQRTAIERSRRVVVIADGSKLGRVTPVVVAPADRVHVLVTDQSAPRVEIEPLARLGIDVVVAGGGRDRRRNGHAADAEPEAARRGERIRVLAGSPG
jgi:DeoR family transcriptional regulator of aga operon